MRFPECDGHWVFSVTPRILVFGMGKRDLPRSRKLGRSPRGGDVLVGPEGGLDM